MGRPSLNRDFRAAIMPVRIRLRRALNELKADGTIDRFAAKYFDVKVVVK
jgi:ABC-type amino acid transport substrate-binding protein